MDLGNVIKAYLAAKKQLALQSIMIKALRPEKRVTHYPGDIRVTDDGPINKRLDFEDEYDWDGATYRVVSSELIEVVTVEEIS